MSQRPDEQKYLATSHVTLRNTSVRDSCRAHPRGRRRSEKNKQQKAQAEEAAGWNTLSSVFIDGQTIQTREKTDELLFVTCRHTYTIVGV